MRPVGARPGRDKRDRHSVRGPLPTEKRASPGPRAPLDPGHCLASASQQGGIAAGPGAPTGCPVHYPPGPGTTQVPPFSVKPPPASSAGSSLHRVGQQPTPTPGQLGGVSPPAEPLQPGLTHHVQDTLVVGDDDAQGCPRPASPWPLTSKRRPYAYPGRARPN